MPGKFRGIHNSDGSVFLQPLNNNDDGEGGCCSTCCSVVLGAITLSAIIETFVSAFLFSKESFEINNIVFAAVMTLIGLGHLIQICCGRSCMVYFNVLTILLLCAVGNLYIHNIDLKTLKPMTFNGTMHDIPSNATMHDVAFNKTMYG